MNGVNGDQTKSAPREVLAMALALGSLLVCYRVLFSGTFAGISLGAGLGEADVMQISAFVRFLAVLALLFLGKWGVQVFRRSVLVGSGLVLAASMLVLGFGEPPDALAFACASLVGVASGIIMMALAIELCHLSLPGIVQASLIATASAGVILLSLPALGASLALSVLSLLAVLSAAALLVKDPLLEACAPEAFPDAEQLAGFPWFAALFFLIAGMGGSFMFGVALELGWNDSGYVSNLLAMVLFLAAITVTCVIIAQGRDMLPAVWIPLFSLYLAALVLMSFSDEGADSTAMTILAALVASYYFLRFGVMAALITSCKVSRYHASGIALLFTGGLVNIGLGQSMAATLPVGLQLQSGFVAIAALGIMVVLLAVMFVGNHRSQTMVEEVSDFVDTRVKEAVDTVAAQIPVPEPSLEERCEALSQAFGLTPRESEILASTAAGYSSTFIAEKFVVSASTVRFHQQNIYRKLGVHSRQELLSLVNEA